MTTAYSGSGNLSRSLELLWQGKNRAIRGPKPGLNLERIVATAVEIADREGLAAVSMRSVATELDVGTMSLYRYVPGKGELLDLMLDHVYQPNESAEPDESAASAGDLDFRGALEWLARGTWRLYHRHPWLLQVNQARPVLGPNAMRGFNLALAKLKRPKLTGHEKIKIIMAVDHYVTGTARTYLFQQQAAEQSGVTDEEFWTAQGPILQQALDSGAFPEVAALEPDVFAITGEEALEYGLGALLDGLVALVAKRAAAE